MFVPLVNTDSFFLLRKMIDSFQLTTLVLFKHLTEKKNFLKKKTLRVFSRGRNMLRRTLPMVELLLPVLARTPYITKTLCADAAAATVMIEHSLISPL